MAAPKGEHPIDEIADAAQQAARAESEPAPVRRSRAVLFQGTLILIASTFAVLTFIVKTMPLFAIDVQITRSIQLIKIPSFAFLMNWISWAGYGPQNFIIVLVIVLVIYSFGLHWEAIMAVIAAVFSGAVNFLVKDLVQRPRPAPNAVSVFARLNSYSFPSGHVMFYLGFFGFIGFLAFTMLKPSYKRSLLLSFISVPIVLIGVSRIYLGEHWASDVLGAYLLGSLTLVAIVQFYLWGKTRFFVHQPVAASTPQQPEKGMGKLSQGSIRRSINHRKNKHVQEK
jgi:membrane-associated phospholipid phosphatase